MPLVLVARHKLIKARLDSGLTQGELAQELGTSQTSISRWEGGMVSPSAYYKKRLCDFFRLSASNLGLDVDQTLPLQEERVESVPLVGLHLIGRERELEQLQRLLIGGESLVAVSGLPGVGKTALVAALVQYPHIREHFPDGMLWAPLGVTPNRSIFRRWGKMLGIAEEERALLETPSEWEIALRNAIGFRRMLIILDDAWKEETAQAFKVGGPNCKHIVTTRFPSVASSLTPTVLALGELDEVRSLLLLQTLAPESVECAPDLARKFITTVGGLPLALRLAGGYLRKEGRNRQPRRIAAAFERLGDVKERLHLAQAHSPDEPHALLEEGESVSLHSLLAVSDCHLSPQARAAFYALGVLPERPATFLEEAALAVARCGSEIIDELADAGLLEVNDGRYALHQVIADYARFHLKLQPEEVVSEAYQCLVTYTLQFASTYQEDFDRLDRECYLYRVALEGADEHGFHRQFVQLAAALAKYIRKCMIYSVEFYLIRAFQIATKLESAQDYPCLMKILEERIRMRLRRGDHATALSLAQFGLKRTQEAGDITAHALFLKLINEPEPPVSGQDIPDQWCGIPQSASIDPKASGLGVSERFP